MFIASGVSNAMILLLLTVCTWIASSDAAGFLLNSYESLRIRGFQIFSNIYYATIISSYGEFPRDEDSRILRLRAENEACFEFGLNWMY